MNDAIRQKRVENKRYCNARPVMMFHEGHSSRLRAYANNTKLIMAWHCAKYHNILAGEKVANYFLSACQLMHTCELKWYKYSVVQKKLP